MELVVTLAVIGALATIVFVSRKPEAPWDDSRYHSVADQLERLSRAIGGVELFPLPRKPFILISFVQDVTIAPGRLSDLTRNISSDPAAPNSKNCRGSTYSEAQEARKWSGPYWHRDVNDAGLVLGRNFVAQDVLVSTRFDPVAYGLGTNLGGFLAIRMLDVPLDDAKALGMLVDGVDDGTGGTVRFTPAGSSPVTVDYRMVVSRC